MRGGVAGVEEPVENQHHRQVGDPRQIGDLVDDVHEAFGGHPSSFSDAPQGGDMACVGAAAPADDPEPGHPGDHRDERGLQLGGIALVILVGGSWMLHEMISFTQNLFDSLPSLLGL